MTADPFSVPSGGGSGLDELVGRLLVLTDIEVRENVPNPFDAAATRDEADAAIYVLDGDGNRPKGSVYGARLVRQCKARAAFGWAYGRLAKVNVQGREALELIDPGPADTERVRAWLTAYAPHYLHGAQPAAPGSPSAAPSPQPTAAPAAGATWHPGTAAPPPAGFSAPLDPPF